MNSVITRHSPRIAPLALAGVLVLGACGSDDDTAATATDGDTVPPAADGPLAPIPVRTAGGGAQGGAAATAEVASDSRMATDMMMPFRITNFVVGDGLPALPTNDLGYVFQMGAAVTADQVTALATSLGVTGEPVRTDEGYGVSWRVGPDDGSAPAVWVYEDAQLSWNYSSAWALTPGYAGCTAAESPPRVGTDGATGGGTGTAEPAIVEEVTVVDECIEPAPPANVPTADDAEARTRELMGALGLDPAAFTFEPYADEWSASVSAVEQLGDLFTGRRVDVGFGAEGVMQYAGGQLAEPQPVGPYPLIGLDEAVERLRDQSGFYAGGIAMSGSARATAGGDVAVSSESVLPEPAVDPAVTEATEPGVIEPAPVDSIPLEEVTVTLVDVEADIWWTMDVDGSVFLLPAYRFIGDDGGWYTVPAVTDEFLVQVEPDVVPMPEPMPVESVPMETVPFEITPVETKPEILPTETIPGEPVEFDTAVLEASIGSSLADFTSAAEALGASVRVTKIDGVDQAATMDYSPMRVNVAVEGDIVTEILGVG